MKELKKLSIIITIITIAALVAGIHSADFKFTGVCIRKPSRIMKYTGLHKVAQLGCWLGEEV